MGNDQMDVERRRKGSEPVGRAEAPQREGGGSQGGGFPPQGATCRRLEDCRAAAGRSAAAVR